MFGIPLVMKNKDLEQLATRMAPKAAPLNSVEVAKELGLKSTWIVKGIKIAGAAAGDSPFIGQYTAIERVLAWVENHKDFVASHHMRKPMSAKTPTRRSVTPKNHDPDC